MNILYKKGAQVIFAVPFLVFGCMHFFAGPQMVMAVPSWLPGGVFWVYFTGLCLIAAAISIVTGKLAGCACKLLAVLLLIFILTIHLPGMGDPQMQKMAMIGLLKDLGLLGGALGFAGMFDRE